MLRKASEEGRSHLHHSGSPKSRITQHVISVIVKLWSVTSKVVTSSLEGIAGLTIISDVADKLFVFNMFLLYLRGGFNLLPFITKGTQVIFRHL
jgi:hypothetical protein